VRSFGEVSVQLLVNVNRPKVLREYSGGEQRRNKVTAYYSYDFILVLKYHISKFPPAYAMSAMAVVLIG
jgi:hypothetical protein